MLYTLPLPVMVITTFVAKILLSAPKAPPNASIAMSDASIYVNVPSAASAMALRCALV